MSETSSDPKQPGRIIGGKVALKFLLPSVAAQPDYVRRFMREARAAVKIHSEHVARVLDVGVHDGIPYMVMEYLEGADLSEVLAERGALPQEEAGTGRRPRELAKMHGRGLIGAAGSDTHTCASSQLSRTGADPSTHARAARFHIALARLKESLRPFSREVRITHAGERYRLAGALPVAVRRRAP